MGDSWVVVSVFLFPLALFGLVGIIGEERMESLAMGIGVGVLTLKVLIWCAD